MTDIRGLKLSALVDMVGKLEDAEQSGQKKRLFNLRSIVK